MNYEQQQEFLRSLVESDDEEDVVNYVDDESDEEWLPSAAQKMNEEDSDVEDVRQDDCVRIEMANEDSEDSDEEANDDAAEGPSIEDNVLRGRDGTIWRRNPTSVRTLSHNIVRQRAGPIRSTNLLSALDTFKCIFNDVMCNIIIKETNRKANSVYEQHNSQHPERPPKVWKMVTAEEFDSYLGILITAGVRHSNNEHIRELWKTTAYPLYRASMGVNRFCSITRFLRFDNPATRGLRLESDKAAAISEIFMLLNNNLRSHYVPSECVVVDEQLFPYRGRTRFTQYMPSKPAKYGIKVWWVCNASNSYPITGQIYTGKQLSGREVNQGERVVKDLCMRFKGSGRNIVADNFFTSLPLARLLKSWNLSIVGTLKKNKPYIPKEMLPSKSRDIFSSHFAFSDDNITICSYVPKKNKSVIMLSTLHYTDNVSGNKKKPEIIHYYNGTKSGVDNMDKLLGHYSTKRRTQRWPVAFFYNILDVACLAAYKIYCENHPTGSNQTHQRRIFLKDLGRQLALRQITTRSTIINITRNFESRTGIECMLGRPILPQPPEEPAATTSRDCSGRIVQTGKCYVCLTTNPKRRRATRKSCHTCNKPICSEHTITVNKCHSCN